MVALALYSLLPTFLCPSVSSVTASIEVVPGADSFRVRCSSTGGRALDMTVSGPRGFTADISSRIEPVGDRRWLALGSDQYTATTDLISGGEDGDEYWCTVTSYRTESVTLRGILTTLFGCCTTAYSEHPQWLQPSLQ